MNIFILTLVIFVIAYIFLNWFAKTSSQKISKLMKRILIFSSILLAVIMAFAGRYIFSLPFLLAVLPLIKTKAGFTLLQFVRIWSLLRVLKGSGRFNFGQNQTFNNQTMSLSEAYKILNLDPNKKYTKPENIKLTEMKHNSGINPNDIKLEKVFNKILELKIK